MQKFFVSFDKTKICYDHTLGSDDKPSLILLHGFGGDLTAWNEEIQILNREGYSTIAVDLRGHGLSDRPDGKDNYVAECFVKDIVEIINFEKIRNPVLIGHCFGGMQSIVLAGSFPELFKGLVLIDTNYKAPDVFFFQKFQTVFSVLKFICGFVPRKSFSIHIDFAPYKYTSDYNLKRLVNDIIHVSPKTYITICEVLTHLNVFDYLRKIKMPTLILEGRKDTIFPPSVARELHREIVSSELRYVENANHIVILSHPQEVSEAISSFVKKIAQPLNKSAGVR